MATIHEQFEEEMKDQALAARYQKLEELTEELSGTMHDSAHLPTLLEKAQALVIHLAQLIEFENVG